MTNEQAIRIILENKEQHTDAEKLAAMYACDDILDDDIDTWLGRDVSEYLMQFPDTARSLADDLISDGAQASDLSDGLCGVAESMFHYVKFHEVLTSYDMALSER